MTLFFWAYDWGQESARHLLLTDSQEEIIQALVRFDQEQQARRATG